VAPLSVETSPGVTCERMIVPLNAVGLYVPAGTAPLPSTAIMLAIPARIAGCPVRVLCTPPRPDGTADPAVLVAARLCGVEQVFKLGGAQAVAAMAYGTASVPKVDKIFGPAIPGSPPPSRSSPPTPMAPRSTCRPDRPKCWSLPTRRRDLHSSRPTCWRRPSTARTRRWCWSPLRAPSR
jgi:hypothetical protein